MKIKIGIFPMNEALHQYAKIDPQADFEIQQHMS